MSPEPRRVPFRVWPGFGSWHLKRHGTLIAVRYSIPTRSGSFLATTMEIDERQLQAALVPLDSQVRDTVARQIRDRRRAK
ncbi:MAG: hypothetical protein PHS14_18335 [Elusimicrobia bacterium]|nr:hypothetical protein [Elusimicrobiota bacterium]